MTSAGCTAQFITAWVSRSRRTAINVTNDTPGLTHADITKMNLSGLPAHEREHLLLHQKHFGHEGMHATMLLILVVAICVAQVVLIWWKKNYPKPYQNVSMFCMWLIPFFISIYNHWWRFIAFWY